MKQVIFLLAAVILLASCNSSGKVEKNEVEQLKMKLLKQAGFDKMEKTFTFDYSIQNDAAVARLSFVNTDSVINFNEADSVKGMLLNVFTTPDGHQYGTRLKMGGGGLVQIGVQIINGVEMPVYTYVQPQLGGGLGSGIPNPPPLCGDGNCGPECLWNCDNYFRYNILPGLQKRADSSCTALRYCYPCPLGAIRPCYYVLVVVVPHRKNCNVLVDDPWRIATEKLSGGIVVKIVAAKKAQQ